MKCLNSRLSHLIIFVLFGIVGSLLTVGCVKHPKKYVIGVSQCSEDIWRDKLNDELKMGEYLNDSIIVKLGKRLRVYTIVAFSFVRTFAP